MNNHDSIHYHLLKQIQDNPGITQRQLAQKSGISLGKTNYCINALIEKGLVKVDNFKNSKNRSAYLYKLTPKGLEEKSKVTFRFLQRKLEEYEAIKSEIEELKVEIGEDMERDV